jgi:hypothetical protein
MSETEKKPGDLLAEQAAAGGIAALGTVAPVAAGALLAAKELASAGKTEGSMQQYLIASGGASQSENAQNNAILSALNRFAGYRTRM